MGLPAMPPPSTAPPGMAPTGATDIAQVHATAPSNVERSIHGQPPSGGAGGRGTGKRKAIDDFLDEIKSKQSRREPPSAPRGSHNDGYYKSTNNVFLGNIDPALNEQSMQRRKTKVDAPPPPRAPAVSLASFKELAERSNLKDSFTEAFVLLIPRNPLHLDRSHNARPEKQSVRECS